MHIYGLYFNNRKKPFYIGKTKDASQRYNEHARHCFKHAGPVGRMKLYKYIRGKGITKDTFKNKIKMRILEKPRGNVHTSEKYWIDKYHSSLFNTAIRR